MTNDQREREADQPDDDLLFHGMRVSCPLCGNTYMLAVESVFEYFAQLPRELKAVAGEFEDRLAEAKEAVKLGRASTDRPE